VCASSTEEFTDDVNTDAVAAGYKVNWKITTGSGFNNLIFTSLGVAFSATTNTVVYYSAWGSKNLTAASTTTYCQLGGIDLQSTATDLVSSEKRRIYGTLK